MTAELVDIKDRTPNAHTIDQLERLLGWAKEGELRTFISVCAWDDGSTTHGWAADFRNLRKALLAELTIVQHEFLTNLSVMEKDSILSRTVYFK